MTEAKPIDLHLSGSKSLTNRALLLSALAKGRTTLSNALFAEDTEVMLESLRRLGFTIEAIPELCRVLMAGKEGILPVAEASLDVKNAGTASRFLAGLCCLSKGKYRISGAPRMHERPVSPLVGALRAMGVSVAYLGKSGSLPLEISSPGAGKLAADEISIESDVSSQFISALLMIAPYIKRFPILRFSGEVSSRPYIDMTLKMMKAFGAFARSELPEIEPKAVHLGALRPYVSPGQFRIEPDASTAAYYFALGLFSKTPIQVSGLTAASIQGDYAFLEFLKAMGAKVEANESSTRVSFQKIETLTREFDFNDIPDQVMTACAVTALTHSRITIQKVGNLRVKECDRLAVIEAGLTKLGVTVKTGEDWIHVEGNGGKFRTAKIETKDDHRIAMSFALLKIANPKISFDNPGCVSKSSPDFWKVYGDACSRAELVNPTKI